MRKYENFCNALSNMKDIYNYEEPYDNVVITGLVGLYEICFEQSWKMMKEILEIHGYAEEFHRKFVLPCDWFWSGIWNGHDLTIHSWLSEVQTYEALSCAFS